MTLQQVERPGFRPLNIHYYVIAVPTEPHSLLQEEEKPRRTHTYKTKTKISRIEIFVPILI